MKIQISNLFSLTQLLLISTLYILTLSAAYNYSACNSTYYFNPANLACLSCQNNQVANSYQTIPIACQCSSGYLPLVNGTGCTSASTLSCQINNSYFPIYNRDGSINTTTAANCVACADKSYVNKYCGCYEETGVNVLLVEQG